MQLRFPKKRDFWSWNELSYLSKAIGFSTDLFKRNVPKEKEVQFKDGLRLQDIEELIDSKALAGDLHRTFNMHDASYNTKVIQKSVELLSNRFLTFQQINEARMAFQLYEHMDNAGLVINEHIISRTLKLCGRAISHKKLMQHIKHIDRLVQDRLMFYEFLEILLICEKLSDVKIHAETVKEKPSDTKDDRNLYPLEDFRDILLTEDEKISEKLNDVFKKNQEKIPVKKSNKTEEIGEKKPWHDKSIVDHKVREEMVSVNKWQKGILNEHLQISNQEVLTEGTFPSCNCNKEVDVALRGNKDSKEHAIEPEGELSKIGNKKNGVEHLKYRREQLVTATDLDETRIKMDDLLWNIGTQVERMRKRHETAGRRRKRHQPLQAYQPADAVKDKQPSFTTRVENIPKGNEPLDSSREFRKRLKDISTREAQIQSDSWPSRKERPKAECNSSDGSVDKIQLDERLKQIDMLMTRVCQR